MDKNGKFASKSGPRSDDGKRESVGSLPLIFLGKQKKWIKKDLIWLD
jgi:hypothetical protein